MSRDVAGLDDYDHKARVEMPAREAVRRIRDRLHLDVRRVLGLELDPIVVYLDAVGEACPLGQDRRRGSCARARERDRGARSGNSRDAGETEDELPKEIHMPTPFGQDINEPIMGADAGPSKAGNPYVLGPFLTVRSFQIMCRPSPL